MLTCSQLNVSVSAIYWSLIIFFPQLILGQNPVGSTEEAIAGAAASGVIPFFIPLKYDLALHLLPAIAILADFIFFEKQFPSVWCKRVPATMGVYGLFYSSWVEFCAKQNDGWCKFAFSTIPLVHGSSFPSSIPFPHRSNVRSACGHLFRSCYLWIRLVQLDQQSPFLLAVCSLK